MPKIVLSQEKYWVGKELYEGSKYWSFSEEVHELPIEQVVNVSMDEILFDINKHMRISASEHSDIEMLKKLAHELCNNRFGMIYCTDWKSTFGVRKIVS